MSRLIAAAALTLLIGLIAPTAMAQSVYGAWALPVPDNGQRQVGLIDPTTGAVSLLGPGALDPDDISTTTGITAIALAANVFYFIGEDQGDGLSKLYSVDLDTGLLNPSPAVTLPAGYGVGQVQGLWYSDGNATLYGLFTAAGGDRQLVSIDTGTGAVTVVQALVANAAGAPGPLPTASGVLTGDPDGNRVFFVGTLDAFGEPALLEVSLSDGTTIAHIGDGTVDENNVVGIEWDTENQTIWTLYRAGEVFFGELFFEEGESFVQNQIEVSFDPIGTQTGLTALDDATGQFFFIGLSSGWRIFTIDVNTLDGTENGGAPANPQPISGAIFAAVFPGIEVLPGPQISMTKSDGGVTAVPGNTISYDLALSNAADAGPGQGLVLSETVPAETTFNAGASTAGWACSPDASAGSICTLALADLPPAGSTNVTFAVTLNSAVSAGLTQIDNTAELTASNSTEVVQATDFTPIDADVDLSVTKTDGGFGTTPGGFVVYSIQVINSGNREAADLLITETIPANTVFNAVSSDPAWVCPLGGAAGQTCELEFGSLAGNDSSSLFFVVDVIPSVAAGTTQIDNTVTVESSNAPTVMASDFTPVTAAPVLALTKTDGGANANPGSLLSYALDYQNTGNMDTLNAVLTDTVPAQTTFFASASSPGWSCVPDNSAGSVCSLAIGTLAGGGSGSATFVVTVDDPVLANTASIDNQASFGADNAPAAPASDSSPVISDPVLTLSKTAAGQLSTTPGGTPSFVLVYGNSGNENAADVVMTETVPDHTTFRADKSTPGWVCVPDTSAGSSCTFDIGTLNGGSSDIALFTVEVDNPVAEGATAVDNTASIDASNNSGPPVASLASLPIDAQADLVLSKDDGVISAIPGDTITWQLDYANTGNQDAGGVILLETVPANTTFNAGASDPAWNCADASAGSSCFLDLFTLAGGASGSAGFAVTVDAALPLAVTSIDNAAELTAAGVDPGNASDSTPVAATLDLAIVKSDGAAIPTPGGVLVYALDYANNGNTEANGVTLTETVPANTTFNGGASTAGWVCVPDGTAGSACTFDLGTLAAGASGSVDFAVDLPDPFPAMTSAVENTASIADDGVLGADQVPANNVSTVSTTLDDTPPTVIGVSAPSIGPVASCDQLDGLVDSLRVSFEDDLTPIQGADQASNYLLVDAGPDGRLDTLACGAVAGDDRSIAITGVTITGPPLMPMATLALANSINGQPYHLLVCDSISDGAGNALAGGDFLRRFRVDRGNRFDNAYLDDCSDQPVALPPWSTGSPSGLSVSLLGDVDGDPGSGSLQVDGIAGQDFVIDQCATLDSSGGTWLAEARFNVVSGSAPVQVQLTCATYDSNDCSGSGLGVDGPLVSAAVTNPTDWGRLDTRFDFPAGTQSARCGVYVVSQGDWTIRFDALRLVAPLFRDRFEGN